MEQVGETVAAGWGDDALQGAAANWSDGDCAHRKRGRTRPDRPPGFAGKERGEYGELGYARHCTRDERMALAAMRARREIAAPRRRDLYFTRVKGFPAPT